MNESRFNSDEPVVITKEVTYTKLTKADIERRKKRKHTIQTKLTKIKGDWNKAQIKLDKLDKQILELESELFDINHELKTKRMRQQ